MMRKTVDYRRNLLHRCTDITYLDSRPVTDKDRKCLAAWARARLVLGAGQACALSKVAALDSITESELWLWGF